MKRNARTVWTTWLPLLLLVGVAASLAGCDSAAGGTARVAATATAMPCPTGTPALAAGWAWYHDASYPFQIAFPTTWRSGAFAYTGGANVTLAHVVDFFPPGSTGQASAVGRTRADLVPRVVNLEVDLYPTAQLDPATNPYFSANKPRVCVSGVPVTTYTLVDTDDGGNIETRAVVQLGHDTYRYDFTLVSPATTAAPDSQLFTAMLASFAATAQTAGR